MASCLRYRHQEAHGLAQDRLQDAAAKIKAANAKCFIHYDTKQIEEDLDGIKKKVERLVIVLSSPALDRPVLLIAFPLEDGKGETMADAVWEMLNMLGLLECIGGIVADTTASNFGAWRGSITILQVNPALRVS